MEEYNRWANVPKNLKTRNQLKEAGLRPARGQEPVAIFGSPYGDWKLYDIDQAVPRQPANEKRQAQLAAAREKADRLRTCTGFGKHCGEYLSYEDYGHRKKRHNKPDGWQYVCRFCRERQAASEWARDVLADPGAVILDTETTGLDDTAEIVEIAIINTQGQALFNRLVRPHGPMGATHIHGITADDVATAPSWAGIDALVFDILQKASRVIVYNVEYDRRLIYQTQEKYGIPTPLAHWATGAPLPPDLPKVNWDCAMEEYARWVGDWSSYHGSYKWQRLDGDHRALGDARACLEYIKRMAKEETGNV